jgi:hypothetical protein
MRWAIRMFILFRIPAPHLAQARDRSQQREVGSPKACYHTVMGCGCRCLLSRRSLVTNSQPRSTAVA